MEEASRCGERMTLGPLACGRGGVRVRVRVGVGQGAWGRVGAVSVSANAVGAQGCAEAPAGRGRSGVSGTAAHWSGAVTRGGGTGWTRRAARPPPARQGRANGGVEAGAEGAGRAGARRTRKTRGRPDASSPAPSSVPVPGPARPFFGASSSALALSRCPKLRSRCDPRLEAHALPRPEARALFLLGFRNLGFPLSARGLSSAPDLERHSLLRPRGKPKEARVSPRTQEAFAPVFEAE